MHNTMKVIHLASYHNLTPISVALKFSLQRICDMQKNDYILFSIKGLPMRYYIITNEGLPVIAPPPPGFHQSYGILHLNEEMKELILV